MIKLIKRLLERFSLTFALFGTVAIAYLSLANLKGVKMPITFKFIDKVEHFTAYFLLSFFWLLSIGLRPRFKINTVWVCLMVILFGLILEFLQFKMTDYRSGDIYDFIANSLGVTFGALVFKSYKNKILKQSN